jgi:hypothetical protein
MNKMSRMAGKDAKTFFSRRWTSAAARALARQADSHTAPPYTFYEYRECKKETNGKMWVYWDF